jgi:hypothetical protein
MVVDNSGSQRQINKLLGRKASPRYFSPAASHHISPLLHNIVSLRLSATFDNGSINKPL